MRLFLLLSLILHVSVIYFFYSSEKLELSAPSDVEIAVIEQVADTGPTNLESENILPSQYEKVQRAEVADIPAETNAEPKGETQKPKAKTSVKSASSAPPAPAPAVKAAATAPVAAIQNVASSDLGLKAKYPRLSRMLSEQGRVVVLVHTNENGHVKKMSVTASSGFARLDEAALDAVSNSANVSYDKNSRIKISFLFKLK